jgi:hypothetical protein
MSLLPDRGTGISRESELSGHNVIGHFSDKAGLAEGVGPDTDESVRDADTELNGHHAGRVLNREVEVRVCIELFGQATLRRCGLSVDHPMRDDLCEHQGIGELVGSEDSRSVEVEVDSAETSRALA